MARINAIRTRSLLFFPVFRFFQKIDQELDQKDEEKNNEENSEPVEQAAYMPEHPMHHVTSTLALGLVM